MAPTSEEVDERMIEEIESCIANSSLRHAKRRVGRESAFPSVVDSEISSRVSGVNSREWIGVCAGMEGGAFIAVNIISFRVSKVRE
jgi:hypothetical protein